MKQLLSLCLALLLSAAATLSFGQKANKLIKQKQVAKIIKTLSSDDMKGRSAMEPVVIDRAAAFIDKQFAAIGLSPLPGATGFRQDFQKQKITRKSVEVTIDGQTISPTNVLVYTEKATVDITGGLTVHSVPPNTSPSDPANYLFGRISPLLRDTLTSLVLVDASLEAGFRQLQAYFGDRLASGRPGTKVFVLGPVAATSYSIHAVQNIETIRMANIVGILPGKSKPDEMVLFSSHYDHIGIQAPVAGDSIANGADDDASGTTAVISLARYYKKMNNNARSLVFVAFTAEEIGGHGSKHFSQQMNPDKVVAMFNIEMIGKQSKWGAGAAFLTGYEKSDLGKIMQASAGTLFQFNPDPYPEQNLFYRSDNATLARLGVPAHTISTSQIDADKFYHTVDDEFETLDVSNIVAAIRAIALGAQSIVDGQATPARIDKTAVR